MCGIIGYTGSEPALPFLLEGLKRLEYRGYDSAGTALCGHNRLQWWKTAGKVQALAELLPDPAPNGVCGIAHTRWATHGIPSRENAHPHLDAAGRIAVVHNGIIENYAPLRQTLEAAGYRFASDTDSEVIAHLIAGQPAGNPEEAVAAALRLLWGTWGIAVIFADHPGTIIAARSGSPVIIGRAAHGNFVASDLNALAGFASRAVALEDGEIAVLTADDVELHHLTSGKRSRPETPLEVTAVAAERGEYEHFMLKEIFEQPEAIGNTLRGRLLPEEGNAKLTGLDLSPRELAAIDRIVIAGCGSSLHAGLIGEYYFEEIAGIPAEVEQAAEFRYRNPIVRPNTLVLPISQSGETADTIAAVREARQKGALVAALSNVVGSTIARECGRGLYLHAGPEISVASTKAFTCQVVALWLLALRFGRNRRLGCTGGQALVRELEALPEQISRVLDLAPEIRRIAEKYAGFEHFFFIGRGPLYPAAREGALKLKEISYVFADGCHAAELKHGPISLLGPATPVIALANRGPGHDKLLGNIAECRARRSPIIALATTGDDETGTLADDLVVLPEASAYATPILDVVALQLFAYYFARQRKCEIDQPRNLAKSVTVE